MSQKGYDDILEPRRMEFSNWFWASRALKPQVAVKLKPRPSPEFHKAAVLKNRNVSELIERIAQQQNVKKEKVEEQVIAILEEIGYAKTLKIIRYLGYALTKIFLKVSSGIFINYDGVCKVKSEMGNCPVVFVPSHRSYADFIIFSYVCFYYDIEIPAIAAGMDFHGMMGMGEMLRNTGAFFMRRSYSNDGLYWTVFKEYIHQLVCKGDVPIEFFIEGTRSRSNKSVAPKYGLINMILKSYFLSEVPDILFVPVSINYDRILEENLFAFELLGIPKPKESTSGFFKSLRILKENFGNIYFHFGEPISSRNFFEGKVDRSKHAFGSLHSQTIFEEEKQAIPPLAYEIIRRQQLSCVVSCFNLAALVLNNNITRGQEFTTLQDLAVEINILREIVGSWGATIFEQSIEDSIKECLLVHQNLIRCYENGNIGLVTNKVLVGKLDSNKLKAHALSEDTISYSVPFLMLQIYANPVLHYLVDAALVVIILRTPGKMNKDDLFRHFCTIRALFCYEFVLLESWYKQRFEEAISRLIDLHVIVCRDGYYDIFENNYFEEVLISSIQPFILTYYIVTEILQRLPNIVNEKTVFSRVQELLEDAISERKIFIHPYCMSLDTLGNCLNSLAKINIVRKSKEEGENIYEVNRDSVGKLKVDLEIYIPSFYVIKSFDIFLHLKSKL